MSHLQKTIALLRGMREQQLERIYHYALFLSAQDQPAAGKRKMEDINRILDDLTGIVPDTGKSLDEYREERLRERYGDFG